MKIIKLAPSQHREGRWLVWLDDGSLLRVSQNEVADFGLYQEMELNPAQLSTLMSAAEASAMKAKALNSLSAHPMSRKELIDKLTSRSRRPSSEGEEHAELPDEKLVLLANTVADRLEELGLLNDAEYALQVARHYSAKGYGPHKIKDELFRRGVPREYWDSALDDLIDPAEIIDDLLEKKLRSASPTDRSALRRAAASLARRGFRWEDISAALARRGEYSDD